MMRRVQPQAQAVRSRRCVYQLTRGARRFALTTLGLGISALSVGCPPSSSGTASGPLPGAVVPTVSPFTLGNGGPEVRGPVIALSAARREWASFTLQLDHLPPAGELSLRLRPLAAKGAGPTIDSSAFEVYQILPMPVDVNRADYVRHTGRAAEGRMLPRALFPIPTAAGRARLALLRDPARPTNPAARPPAGASVQLWVDLNIPADAAAGDYEAACDVVSPASPSEQIIASAPLKLTVENFALPAERHLQMIAQVRWDSLVRHFPADFETVTPRLINRADPKYAGTVRVLDDLVNLARRHRLAVIVPRLQPTVKWPALVQNPAPNVTWDDFDSVVTPWLKGNESPGGPALDYWPLPEPDDLKTLDPQSRVAYWSAAAAHFDQLDLLAKTSAPIEKITPGRANAADAIELSVEAAKILDAHARVRVSVPLEDDQVQFNAADAGGSFINPAAASRLLTASPNLVFAAAVQPWQQGVTEPGHWLRTDLPGLTPYAGAGGDEHDVRLWAWLAFLRHAQFVMFGQALPSFDPGRAPSADAQAAADPSELIWFYPGQWFGVDQPVPTVQLKWLRRAEQDYEYLWLAKERDQIGAIQVARLITKPVEVPRQAPDPTYTLMCGTADPAIWDAARSLLARTILEREPGKPRDADKEYALNVQTLQWARPQERAMLMGRTTGWSWATEAGQASNWVQLQLGLDIYNAADLTPENNLLAWNGVPAGWQVRPQPVAVPKLETFQVRRATLSAKLDLTKITAAAGQAMGVEFTIDRPDARLVSPLRLVVPVARSGRREGRFSFDGRLDDWTASDLIQDGPLVRMLDRPRVQRQEIELASTSSKIYSGWASESFYVAFDLAGVAPSPAQGGQNFVDYQARRAWGEDLCEMLVQPLYADNTVGPVLHVVCKPNGSDWVERKLDARRNANPWEPFESTGVRYAAAIASGRWTGEVAIPWRILADPKLGPPTLLRFNFAQHRTATGESASWAGPVDFGRDDAFMGLIHLPVPASAETDGAVLNDRRGPREVER